MKYSILLPCILFFSLSVPVSAVDREILISTGEYAPWTSENLEHGGIVNHVIAEIFKREGFSVKYEYFPWKRAYEKAKGGAFHATSYWSYDTRRATDFHFSDAIHEEKAVFFHLKSTPMPNWRTYNDLKDYTIGMTIGYTYDEQFEKAGKRGTLHFDKADSDLLNFRKLIHGRFDIFPMGLFPGLILLNKEFRKDEVALITYHPKPLTVMTGYLLFSKKHKHSLELLKMFNEGLKKAKQERLIELYQRDLINEYMKTD